MALSRRGTASCGRASQKALPEPRSTAPPIAGPALRVPRADGWEILVAVGVGLRPKLEPGAVRDRLHHVRWIGGGSGAGKSIVAARLAARFGLQLHRCETFAAHAARSNPVDDPLLHAFMAMGMDERWLNRTPSVMTDTFHGHQGEGFDLIVEDLLALPDHPPVLVEGFRLLPRAVAPLLATPEHAVWLIPTPQFRRAAFSSRGSLCDIVGRTSDPTRALANLLARDALFTTQVAAEATALQLNVIEVNGELSVDQLADDVAEQLQLTTA